MPTSEICFMTATEMVQQIRDKQLSCREVMEAHLAQIDRVNPIVNAIVTRIPSDEALALADAADEAGAMKVVPLAVAGAFHTSIMGSAVQRLTAVLGDVPMAKPRIPVVSNVDALAHDDPEEIRELLVKQVVSPVLWEDSMRLLLDRGIDQFYEIGPGRVLRGLLKRIDRKAPCESVPA